MKHNVMNIMQTKRGFKEFDELPDPLKTLLLLEAEGRVIEKLSSQIKTAALISVVSAEDFWYWFFTQDYFAEEFARHLAASGFENVKVKAVRLRDCFEPDIEGERL